MGGGGSRSDLKVSRYKLKVLMFLTTRIVLVGHGSFWCAIAMRACGAEVRQSRGGGAVAVLLQLSVRDTRDGLRVVATLPPRDAAVEKLVQLAQIRLPQLAQDRLP